MRFPQTFIDDLRRQADIVRIVQDYVSLKKAGANWVARCPFHKETKPSFSVNPAKEIFYCFGCQKGGSVFNFIMEIERVTFPEAIKIVAEKSGVPLPKMVDDSRFEARKRESDQVIELNQWAMQWWEDRLNGKAATSVRHYLKQRGITDETSRTFHLGFAPDSWDALSTHLRQKGATQQQLELSGLVVKKEEGGSYDRFRGRLMFPVFDAQGKPIAFGGRTLDPEGEPKYLNSPETAAYTKGRHLFGLNLTRDEIRRQGLAILVEGYLDVVIPYQFGVRNIIASLGTALTPEQAKLISRFARKILVNYDGDRAGVQAAKRAIETLLTEDLQVDVLVLDNADPDEFILKEGPEEYERQRSAQRERSMKRAQSLLVAQKRQEKGPTRWRIRAGVPEPEDIDDLPIQANEDQGGEARTGIQFVIDQAVRDRNLHNPADKAAAVEETLPFVRAVRSRIQRREYFDIAMDALRVQPDQRRELWQHTRTGASIEPAAVHEVVAPSPKTIPAEEQLLRVLIADKEVRKIILPRLMTTNYDNLVSADLFRSLIDLHKHGSEINFDVLAEHLVNEPRSVNLLARLMTNDNIESFDEALALAEKCLNTFEMVRLHGVLDDLVSQIAEAERAGDTELSLRLQRKHLDIAKQKDALDALLPRGHGLSAA
jgi:DNA primase catalytic core